MSQRAIFPLAVLVLPLLSSCWSAHYQSIDVGEISGRLTVEWMEPDRFLYIPNKFEPLTFTRSDGTTIQPVKMPTDGGSIPRALWVFRNYSPWGYGPAFIVHDYLFYMQDCGLDDAEGYDLKEAAVVMSEVMKTMMEKGKYRFGEKRDVYLMYKAVQTGFAKAAWEDHDCVTADELERGDTWQPTQIFEVSFE